MKNLIIAFLIFFTTSIYAQIEYEYNITVIDSFNCTAGAQGGMLGLRAVEFNGGIHLSYFMQGGQPSTMKLIYATRNENGLSTETVFEVPSEPWRVCYSKTTLQFDEFGEPHIFVAWTDSGWGRGTIYDYHKINNEWQSTAIADFGRQAYIVANRDGSDGLGFVYWSPIEGGLASSGQIVYASYNGSNWEFDPLSNDNKDFTRSMPSIISYNNKTYVAYGEFHAPDTLITRIYVKENNQWTLDYEDIFLHTYLPSNMTYATTKLGASDLGMYLLYDLDYDGGVPAFIKNEGMGWEPQNTTGTFSASLTSPNIHFDSDNTAFWTCQAPNGITPRLEWIKSDGTGGLIALPVLYYGVWLHDMVLVDDIVYIYYWEGSSSSPYNTPVTFKEIKISIDNILNGISPVSSEFKISLDQNVPNPFSNNTTIQFSIPNSSSVKLTVYNMLGEEISTLVNEKLHKGLHKKQVNLNDQNDGVYFYILSVDGYSISRKMLFIK